MAQGMNIQEVKSGVANQSNAISAQQKMQEAQAGKDFLTTVKSNLYVNKQLGEISSDQREGKGPTPLKLGLTF